MNILFVQESDWIKRGIHQQHQLADRLSVRGHNVCVIDFEIMWNINGADEWYSKRQVMRNVSKVINKSSVTVIRPSIIKIPYLDYVSLLLTHQLELNRQIKEFKPDVIVGFSILNSYLALKAAHKNGIPFIYYWIDVLHRLIPSKSLQFIGDKIERNIVRQADVNLTINDKLSDYMLRIGAYNIRTLRAGVDTSLFKPNGNRESIRNEYGINKNDIVLFFMGWIYKFSGLKEIALQLLGMNENRVKLLIVGEGDDYDEIQQIIFNHIHQRNVFLIGKQPCTEMPNFISASDICILPAYPSEKIMHDIVPIKMYEYLAMEKPVISTRLAGVMREFGKNNGVIYVDYPEEVIMEAINLADSGKINELGKRGRKFVSKYSWENITDEFVDILKGQMK